MIIESVTPLKDVIVSKPGVDAMIRFGELSVSGGVLNAYRALKLAAQMAAMRVP